MIDSREAKLHLSRLKAWAEEKIQGGTEPPWAWYQYMKLVETARAMLDGFEATQQTANSPRSAERSENVLQLRAAKGPQGSFQRPAGTTPVRLPM